MPVILWCWVIYINLSDVKNQNTKLSNQPLFHFHCCWLWGSPPTCRTFLKYSSRYMPSYMLTFWGNVQIYQRNGIFPVHAVHTCSPGPAGLMYSLYLLLKDLQSAQHVPMSTEDTVIAKFVWRWFPAVLTLTNQKTGMFGACIKPKHTPIFLQ